jgi:hypothetical protein
LFEVREHKVPHTPSPCRPVQGERTLDHESKTKLTTCAYFTPDDEGNESTRPLGLIVARGTLLVVISPVDGSEEIENPFLQSEEE